MDSGARQRKRFPLASLAWDALLRRKKTIPMKRIALATLGLFFLSQAAAAAPSWSVISFATRQQDIPRILAATDELMSTATGKEFPGKLLLQAHVADGANPATHSFVPIYKTAAQREAFVHKLRADPAWKDFLEVFTELTQPVSQVLYRKVESWGDIADTDPVWVSHAFVVSDPAAFLAAFDELMASPTGKKFPGQVHLSGVSAGGITPVTHVVSVGYASEAEREAWIQTRSGSAAWATYIEATKASSRLLGTSLFRNLESWGSTTLSDIVAP